MEKIFTNDITKPNVYLGRAKSDIKKGEHIFSDQINFVTWEVLTTPTNGEKE